MRGRGRRGEQECVRTVCLLSLSLTHGDSKSLAAPKCNISPNVSGRFQHCQGQQVCGHGHQYLRGKVGEEEEEGGGEKGGEMRRREWRGGKGGESHERRNCTMDLVCRISSIKCRDYYFFAAPFVRDKTRMSKVVHTASQSFCQR